MINSAMWKQTTYQQERQKTSGLFALVNLCCPVLLYSLFNSFKSQIKLTVNNKEMYEIHGPRMSE